MDFQVCLTKADLVDQNDLARRYYLVQEEVSNYSRAVGRVLAISSVNKSGIPLLRREIGSIGRKPKSLLPKKAAEASKAAKKGDSKKESKVSSKSSSSKASSKKESQKGKEQKSSKTKRTKSS